MLIIQCVHNIFYWAVMAGLAKV